ncbi:MAG: hypothetical protein A3H70_00590 [Candidatus Komeilibacteria bacterium RIFCSPLOWO2_02_FULL_48_11]|uniref:Uncharacterized protein n=1 Tax=Candidatus Komeilibacteria bacterium RIFCSPLOWO2_02_FULL_48_11 TaxID=1798553 RepID=A0A1G2BTX6_9BACT|nr:MAG: hypothetical protein A3H70_00590 [Candidatus Komeilibacteria bacterium RIFCSPLOWO2_02_FULL_48_11]
MLTIFVQVCQSYLDFDLKEVSQDPMDDILVTKELRVDPLLTAGELINMVEPGASIFKQDAFGQDEEPLDDGDLFGKFGWYTWVGTWENLWKSQDGAALKVFETQTVFHKPTT